jgi:hypothetical protein
MRRLLGPQLIASVTLGIGVLVACGSDGNVDDQNPGMDSDGGEGGSSGSFMNGDSSAEGGKGPSKGPGLNGGSGKGCTKATDCPPGSNEECISGVCGCPPYSLSCGGVCLVTANDPKHCGGCGPCMAGQVCAANHCNAAGGAGGGCLPGTAACNGACVDRDTDNHNCGASCTDCTATGKVCLNGSCGSNPNGTFNRTDPTACLGGGPPIFVDPGGGSTCVGNLAQVSFNWGIGSCHQISSGSSIYVDGFNSLSGGYDPAKPQLGGGVGANATFHDDGAANIWGDLWASNTVGPKSGGNPTNGTVILTSANDVHHDLYCGGNLDGTPKVDDKAYTVGSGGVSGPASPPIHVASVKPPVNCKPIDIAGIVAAHATANDNGNVTPMLTAGILMGGGAPSRIDLPCGNFYFTGISQPTTIVAHGRTAIYIEGNISAGGDLKFTLDPTAELDIFVTGTITTGASLTIGSANYPALTRVYVGTTGSFTVQSGAIYGANIWAANAAVTWESSSDYFGSIIVGSLDNQAEAKVHQDTAILKAGLTCPQPGGGGGTGGMSGPGTLPDGGIAPTTCNACTDCGNQACLPGGTCGACGPGADCCAPLICQNGSCVLAVR